jgi:hypothetical protein
MARTQVNLQNGKRQTKSLRGAGDFDHHLTTLAAA